MITLRRVRRKQSQTKPVLDQGKQSQIAKNFQTKDSQTKDKIVH